MVLKQKKQLFALHLVGVLLVAPAIRADSYMVTQLGTLGGTQSNALGINNSGQVVGSATLTGDTTYHATLWQSGSTTPIDLGTLGGNYSAAIGINDVGQVVGTASILDNRNSGSNQNQAALWLPGYTKVTDLGANSAAVAINVKGEVVGYGPPVNQAVMWQSGTTTQIGLNYPSVYTSSANAINASGQVVGFDVISSNSPVVAALWQPGSTTAIELGTFGGISSVANAINDSGQVVGYAYTSGEATGFANGSLHAALWQPGTTTPIDLGTLLGGSLSEALAINASGIVVGGANTSNNVEHAVIWQSGATTPIDLNNLVTLSNGYLEYATGINNYGQIIAEGSNNLAYILTPEVAQVPLPTAIWLFGSVLAGFIGFNRRKTI
jgi:probable HAF family extracellular repeat protein